MSELHIHQLVARGEMLEPPEHFPISIIVAFGLHPSPQLLHIFVPVDLAPLRQPCSPLFDPRIGLGDLLPAAAIAVPTILGDIRFL